MATNDVTQHGGRKDPRKPTAKYEQPRIEKGRRLTDVTGQGAVVPSGAPAPAPRPPG